MTGRHSFVVPLFGLLACGCRVDKDPPVVQWIHPTSNPTWSVSETVPLRLVVSDPAPTSGVSEPATWRIDIGPESGGVWWSTAGTVSAPMPSASDTIQVNWSTPSDLAGSSSIPLLLTAIAEDGEGQRGADFASAVLIRPELTSGPLWSVGGGPQAALTASLDATLSTTPIGMATAERVLHLDGQDLVLVGGAELQGWSVTGGQADFNLWTRPSPSGLLGDHVRVLRRAPSAAGPASGLVGWLDRVEHVGPNGSVIRTWSLMEGETLLDAGHVESGPVVLARTAQGEWRLIAFNPDNGARMGSITWTPEAPGSTGPEGRGWLLDLDGDPTALEADGRMRRWFTEPNGETGLSTMDAPGSGDVGHAGLLEGGGCWLSRDQTHGFLGGMEAVLLHSGPARDITLDRASNLFYLLLLDETGQASGWQRWDAETQSAVGTTLPTASPETRSGSLAHNRPGPP